MAVGLFDRSFMLAVEFHRFGNSRKADLGEVEVDADKELLRMSKKIFECAEYEAITHHDRKVKKWLEGVATPFPAKAGSVLVRIDRTDMVRTKLNEFMAERLLLVDAFIAVYPAKIQEAEPKLRGLFKVSDYPSAWEVKSKFGFSYQFLDFDVPGRLKQLNLAIYEEEREKIQATVASASAEIQQAMRASMLKLVDHMIEIVTPTEDGKKRVFKNASLVRMKEFIANFAEHDLTEDAELAAIVDQARQLLDGVDPEQLRKQEGLRDAIATGFSKIQAAMADMVTDRTRLITIEAQAEAEPAETIAAPGEPQTAPAETDPPPAETAPAEDAGFALTPDATPEPEVVS